MASHELLQGLIGVTLAGSAAIVPVLALRRPLRKVFGAQVAYALWWLVPAAMAAALLPATPVVTEAVPVARVLALPATLALPAAPAVAGLTWQDAALAIWMLGVVACALWLWRAQVAFRRGLGRLLPQGDAWVAQSAQAGLPATLGLLRPQVVLPVDFATRFDAAQQALVLAHEQRHIARGDHWANAAAALLRCLCWCNPLLHYALARMRHDQELACDAAVLATHPQQRRHYGDALLNAQLALQTVPLGCHFGFGHPLKERIVMLRQVNVSAARRNSGAALVALLGCGMAFAAWAVQPRVVPVLPSPPAMLLPPPPPAALAPLPPPPPPPPQAATSATRVTTLQPGTVEAQSRMAAPPIYPEQALKEGSTGVVVLVVDLKADGAVVGVRVDKSSGHAELDQAAMDAAVKWRFQPAMEAGRGVASQVRVPVEFRLDAPADQAAG